MTDAVFNANDAMSQITLKIKGLRVLSIRIWLAAHIFRLAGWVAGCNVEIETPE